jgi:hypothetical protein
LKNATSSLEEDSNLPKPVSRAYHHDTTGVTVDEYHHDTTGVTVDEQAKSEDNKVEGESEDEEVNTERLELVEQLATNTSLAL